MADIVFFPRFVVGRTAYGTTVYWDKRLGLLIKTETPPSLRATSPRRNPPRLPCHLGTLGALRRNVPTDGAACLV